MATKNRTATNGTAETATPTEAEASTLELVAPQVTEPQADEQTDETTAQAAALTEDAETDFESDDFGANEANEAVGDSSTAEVSAVLFVPTALLSQQDAIALLNAANHDLVELLEPLLNADPMQKQLEKLVAKKAGLTETEAAAWSQSVRQLLEDKKRASQSLIRSLIA